MTPFSFDLEKAINAWRAFHIQQRVFLAEDLDELESHLREHTNQLIHEGVEEEAAFHRALQDLGTTEEGTQEYAKVYWKKLKHRNRLQPELAWRLAMLKNYLKVAYRTMKRQKGYTLINVLGLALGLAVCFVIALFVRHELSYDRFHAHAEDLYRIVYGNIEGRQRLATPAPLAPALVSEFPDVVRTVRISGRYGEVLIKQDAASSYENRFYFVDSTFFDAFSFELLEGDARTALTRPFTVVLSETMARKYFGDESPVGQTLNIKGSWDPHDYEITGVVADAPSNSHFKFNFLASYGTRRKVEPNPENMDSWRHIGEFTYVQLEPTASVAQLTEKLPAFYLRHNQESYAGREAPDLTGIYTLQPLPSIHFHSDLQNEFEANSDLRYVYVFSAIALLILLIACINFVNLSTAQSTRRARETGLRKVAGARRTQLIAQHIIELALLTGIALTGAILLALGSLPLVNQVAGVNLIPRGMDGIWIGVALLTVGALAGVLAGVYPAFYLTRIEPVRVLKGLVSKRPSNRVMHHGLVVVQFTVSTMLIVGALTIQRQLDYLQTKRLGIHTEQVIVLPTRNAIGSQFTSFRDALLSRADIENVTTSSPALPARSEEMASVSKGKPGDEHIQIVSTLSVGPGFLQTMGIDLLSGRDFEPGDFQRDRSYTPVILNQAAVRELGWEEPLLKEFDCCHRPQTRVVGVISDFHFQSVKEKIAPVALLPTWWSRFVLVRTRTSDMEATLAYIEDQWNERAPGYPFEYTFQDERFTAMYESEERLANIFGLFSGIAVFIACLGLFGLAAHAAERRTREIGIRKVLGATAARIVMMLTGDFTRLIFIGVLIATPIAYLAIMTWLNGFAYRIELNPVVFLLTAGMILVFALVTTGYQAFKAARTNPVETIRHE